VRRPDDARQHGLTCSQRPLPLSTPRIVVFVLRLDVAVQVFVFMDDAAHAHRFLGWGGELEGDLES
jgi:hypothetical protein